MATTEVMAGVLRADPGAAGPMELSAVVAVENRCCRINRVLGQAGRR
ncbi:hypothetical protein [Nocardiopsis rhodophaea]